MWESISEKFSFLSNESTVRFITRVFAVFKMIYSVIAFTIGMEQPSLVIGYLFITLMIIEFLIEILFLVVITLWFKRKWLILLIILYIPNNLLFRYQIYNFILGITNEFLNISIIGFFLSESVFGVFLLSYSYYQIDNLPSHFALKITKYTLRLISLMNILFAVFVLVLFFPLTDFGLIINPLIIFGIQFIIIPVVLAPILFLWTKYRFEDATDLLFPTEVKTI